MATIRGSLVAVALLLLVSPPLVAGTFSGKVVRVLDGDTVELLDGERTPHRIRLAGIDAPEKAQPFGKRSKGNLAGLVYGRRVTVESHKTDRWGRLVGKVIVDGADAGLAQVEAGLAWHYRQYEREQSPEDRRLYAAAEERARAAKAGLWRDPEPVPPWAWRRGRRPPPPARP